MRGVCAGLPDKRRGRNVHYAMADIGMAAFSVFFMQSPSFLAQQRRLLEGCGRSNCQTLFEMAEIPSDNHIRAMLDPVSPGAFQPVFDATIRTLEAGDGLAPFRRLGDHVLIALDGTEYHRSAKVHCPRCSTISKGGQIEYFHAMVSAALVAHPCAAARTGIRLEPEFVESQDGTEKQDCESRACRRWLAAHGATYAHLKPCLSRRRFVFLPADLRGNTPSQRELPIRLQTGLPPDADGISFRRRDRASTSRRSSVGKARFRFCRNGSSGTRNSHSARSHLSQRPSPRRPASAFLIDCEQLRLECQLPPRGPNS